MNFRLNAFVLFAALALTPVLARGVIPGQMDTFQNGTTNGWFAGGLGTGQFPPVPPHNVPDGGPNGTDDSFLVITAKGGTGPGSRLVAINGTQWAGNFTAAGVTSIEMDLKNLGTTDLAIRLMFEDPMGGPPVDEVVTHFSAVLPVGGGWSHFVFPVTADDLDPHDGSASAALANATYMRIIHAPQGDDEPVVGVLGVDNIRAVPEPSTGLVVGLGIVTLAFRPSARRCAVR